MTEDLYIIISIKLQASLIPAVKLAYARLQMISHHYPLIHVCLSLHTVCTSLSARYAE